MCLRPAVRTSGGEDDSSALDEEEGYAFLGGNVGAEYRSRVGCEFDVDLWTVGHALPFFSFSYLLKRSLLLTILTPI